MRLNVVLTDEQNEAITARAAAEGIPRAELIRQAISSFLEPPEPAPCRDELPMSRPGADEAEKIQELSRALEAVTHERDQALETLNQAEAERDRLAGEVRTTTEQAHTTAAELERLRAEAAARDLVLTEKKDEISWLRAEVSKLNDKLTPAALPEKAGRKWWRWWE